MEQTLLTLFATNFMAYYRTHQAHVNVEGRHFESDHKILGKIYENLQAEIDVIAELLRTCEIYMPSLQETENMSVLQDVPDETQDAIDFLKQTYEDLGMLIDAHLALEEETEDIREYNHIANYAQDRVKALQKFRWMLRSTMTDR